MSQEEAGGGLDTLFRGLKATITSQNMADSFGRIEEIERRVSLPAGDPKKLDGDALDPPFHHNYNKKRRKITTIAALQRWKAKRFAKLNFVAMYIIDLLACQ